MSNPSWDPIRYMRFERERGLPLRDLLHRITITPKTAVDLGCGPGNSTRQLRRAFPKAQLLGIDSDPAMLRQAIEGNVDATWQEGDIADFNLAQPVDVVVANASLHWIKRHEVVVPKWMEMLTPGGQLAVQMPTHEESIVHRIMREVAAEGPWAETLQALEPLFEIHEPAFYYDLLAPTSADVELWTSNYTHVLDDAAAIIEWISGSGLRPYLQALDGEQRGAYLSEFARRVTEAYPPHENGRVLFPFKRIFFIATR